MNTEPGVIRAEVVAQKLISVLRRMEQDHVRRQLESDLRFFELLWFLQWISQPQNFPGGIRRFASELIEREADKLGTPLMLKLGARPWSDAEAMAVHAELPPRVRVRILAADLITTDGRVKLQQYLSSEADADFEHYLRALCEDPQMGFLPRSRSFDFIEPGSAPYYFADCARCLLDSMERWRAARLSTIAETSITKPVFHWLKIARGSLESVMIQGTERFGKTEAARAWCEASPGRARFVETPDGNSERKLWQAVGKALCIEDFETLAPAELCRRIGLVVNHSRLMLVFDEAQFLLPSSYGKTTQPKRLNWVRRQIMDVGVPVGFMTTPQGYGTEKAKFVRKTGFAIGQFDGRLLPLVVLPEKLTAEDLRAIAEKHFEGIADVYLDYLVSLLNALEKRGELHSARVVAVLAKLAFLNAREDGRDMPTIEDIDAAFAAHFPSAATVVQTPCKPAARRRISTPAATPEAPALPVSRQSSLSPDLELAPPGAAF